MQEFNGRGLLSDSSKYSSPLNDRLPFSNEPSAKASKNLVNNTYEDKNFNSSYDKTMCQGVDTSKLQPNVEENKLLTPISETSGPTKLTPNTPGSSQPDTDFWSESSEVNQVPGKLYI